MLTNFIDADGQGKSFDRRVFKSANDKLVEFSKMQNAWGVSLSVLKQTASGQPCTEFQTFQAASILKNKMMFDFAALKQQHGYNDQQVILELRTNLLQILSQLTQPATLAPTFIINTLAIALAYFIIHTHQSWNTIIQDLAGCLSSNVDSVSCLLQVLQYMANDCDNESIVIEDSIKRAFYRFMDDVSRDLVFKQILEQWSLKINQEPASEKLVRMRRQLCNTFYCWIKLRLPESLFANLVMDCPALMALVFDELSSTNVDNAEIAAKTIVELLVLSANIDMFGSIKEYIAGHVEKLLAVASTAIQ